MNRADQQLHHAEEMFALLQTMGAGSVAWSGNGQIPVRMVSIKLETVGNDRIDFV